MNILTPAVLTLALLLGALPARAQAISTQAMFENFNLLGAFAADCKKPASRSNYYAVHRPLDAGRVQRDWMVGPAERLRAAVIDLATGLGPNDIAISWVSEEFGRANLVFRVEGNRHRVLQATGQDGRKTVVDGRLVDGGTETPWFNKCG